MTVKNPLFKGSRASATLGPAILPDASRRVTKARERVTARLLIPENYEAETARRCGKRSDKWILRPKFNGDRDTSFAGSTMTPTGEPKALVLKYLPGRPTREHEAQYREK